MKPASLASLLAHRLPFYYGWVVLACVCCAAVSRAGPAVATLSIFVEPVTREFGWSRTALAGAVSLGGVLAAVFSPMIGSALDRRGPKLILLAAVLTTGITILLLSQIQSLLAFYLLFCIARMNFAGPYDLGIYGAVNSWFVRRRAMASSIVTVAQMAGLTAMPLIGHFAIEAGGWRLGWMATGTAVLVVGVLPVWLLIARRPEDLGLLPDGAPVPDKAPAGIVGAKAGAPSALGRDEPAFTRAEALRTRAFWMLSLYTLMVYPVQAGVSLHQAAHLVEHGLSSAAAVAAVGTFSVTSAFAGLGFGMLLRWIGVRTALAASAVLLVTSTLLLTRVAGAGEATLAAVLFGAGIGGLQTILPVAWADYFGRRNFGAIRGVALTIQVAAQAAGPLLSGILRDWTGTYTTSLLCFAGLSAGAMLAALLVRAPAPGRRSNVID